MGEKTTLELGKLVESMCVASVVEKWVWCLIDWLKAFVVIGRKIWRFGDRNGEIPVSLVREDGGLRM